jgi:class 3 adenylate cyclase
MCRPFIADLFPDRRSLAEASGFTRLELHARADRYTAVETIYRAFDEIARRPAYRLQVCGVGRSAASSIVLRWLTLFIALSCFIQGQTIGDCYVAVTGLPDPRKDHALSWFASLATVVTA